MLIFGNVSSSVPRIISGKGNAQIIRPTLSASETRKPRLIRRSYESSSEDQENLLWHYLSDSHCRIRFCDRRSKRAFDQISMDAATSTGDYPSNFKVEASNDNTNWSLLKNATGSSQHVFTHVPDTQARYIRVTLTSGKGNWWSIHEFWVYG